MKLKQALYDIILADVPWEYKVWSQKDAGRTAAAHYACMSQQELEALNMSAIAEKNCALFLWTTGPQMQNALRLIAAWGFTFKTIAFTWVKTNKRSQTLFWGMGHYTRSNPEFCLLAIKGKPLKRESCGVHSVIQAPVTCHSEKPAEIFKRIDQLFGPDTKKIELFARKQPPMGWDATGLELTQERIEDFLLRKQALYEG